MKLENTDIFCIIETFAILKTGNSMLLIVLKEFLEGRG